MAMSYRLDIMRKEEREHNRSDMLPERKHANKREEG